MSDDLLKQWVTSTDEPRPNEPSFIRGDGHLARLEIREADRNSQSFPYSSLAYMHFNPSAKLTLVFSRCTIELGGINLGPLYEALSAHSVKTILVLPEEFMLETSDATLVDSCKLHTGLGDVEA